MERRIFILRLCVASLLCCWTSASNSSAHSLPEPPTPFKNGGSKLPDDSEFDGFVDEEDFVIFHKTLPSAAPFAEPRKLLIDDVASLGDMLLDFPDSRIIQTNRTQSEESALIWRLKDLSILEQLSRDNATDLRTSEDTDPKWLKNFSDQQKDLSEIVQVRVPAPKNYSKICFEDSQCPSTSTSMSLRQKLLHDLESAHSEPLPSQIEYRLKRRPSIYASKRPQTTKDIGIPDIYEMEVEVTPKMIYEPPNSSDAANSDSKNGDERRSSDSGNQRKFFSPSPRPKFVSLGSLYNARRGSAEIPKAKNMDKSAKENINIQLNPLSRGNPKFEPNPLADGVKTHLTYRRPISFKFKRNESGGAYFTKGITNSTRDLTPIERIALNKTPGIVIEYPQSLKHKNFKSISHGGREQSKTRRPVNFLPGKRRRKNKRKPNTRNKNLMSVLKYKSQKPSEKGYSDGPNHNPKTKSKDISKLNLPNNYTTLEPLTSYEQPSQIYKQPSNNNLPSQKDTSSVYHSSSESNEQPLDEYSVPKKVSSQNYKTLSQEYEQPSMEYAAPKEKFSTKYQPPSLKYEVPSKEYQTSNIGLMNKNETPTYEHGSLSGGYLEPNEEHSQEYNAPSSEYIPPRKTPSSIYHTPSTDFESPSDKYLSNKGITAHKAVLSYSSEAPKNEYSVPDKVDSQEYHKPMIHYETPSSVKVYNQSSKIENISSYQAPTHGKGQVPKWLTNLRKERVHPTPPSQYFPPSTTISWKPITSMRDIGPLFIMPKGKTPSSVKEPSYTSPTNDFYKPLKDSPVKHHYTDNQTPVSLVISAHSKPPTRPSQTHKTLDSIIIPPTQEYLPPADKSIIPVSKQSYPTTTYIPPIYTTPKISVSNDNGTSKKSKASGYQNSNQPQIVVIEEEYDDHDYYYDDMNDYYYDDDEYYDENYYVYEDHDSMLIMNPKRPFMPHIQMSDFDAVIHEVDIMEYGYIIGIPGIAGRDYPILQYIPLTSFRCHLVADYPGYYADMEAGCQVFHVCHKSGRQDSFLCPNGTIFNQKYFVCDWWYNFSCEDAAFFYPVNAGIEFQEVILHETIQKQKDQTSISSSSGLYRNRRHNDRRRAKPSNRDSTRNSRLRRRPKKRRTQNRERNI